MEDQKSRFGEVGSVLKVVGWLWHTWKLAGLRSDVGMAVMADVQEGGRPICAEDRREALVTRWEHSVGRDSDG